MTNFRRLREVEGMRRPPLVLLLACFCCRPCDAFAAARPAIRAASRAPRVQSASAQLEAQLDVLAQVDEWFRNAPYQSAFAITGFKAALADVITQSKEIRLSRKEGTEFVETCDNVSCEVTPVSQTLSKRRALAFLLYGGFYQGCVQYFLFNVCFPVWFGEGTDLQTVTTKVLVDQFLLTPFLCLPCIYLVKALVFNYSLREGLERYVADARRDLLLKYWVLWGPVQFITFGVMPPQYRVPFIALVSFAWLLILSSISSREDQSEAQDATSS